MPNPFERLSHTVFKTTTKIMGYEAEWFPSTASLSQKGRVHFKQNSIKQSTFENIHYSVMEYFIEYYQGTFNGLYELLDNKSTNEKINVLIGDTWREFYAEPTTAVWDGKTFIIRLHVAEDNHPNAYNGLWDVV